jgi:predicted acyltransferase
MPPPASVQSPRLVSLDAFRGATIAAMLLVNNPGSWGDIYAPLEHAPWHGWTPTDMIFPFFLWIVGVSLTLSSARRVEEGADRGQLLRHVVQRSLIIFALGMFLAAFPFGLLPGHHFALAKLRIPGVLQRIALCYLAAGAIFLRTGVRGQIARTAGLLVAYALMLRLIPVPGYGAGCLEPTGNLAWWVDSHLLAGHTWSGAPAPGFDPEGALSTLPAIATTLCGVLAGHFLRTSRPAGEKTGRLLAGGALLLLAGAVLDLWQPINKNLWTSAYVLFMAGWATVIFAAMFWLIDARGWRRWATPLVVFGMNALALFVLAGVIGRLLNLIGWTDAAGAGVTLKAFLYQGFFVPLASPRNASLLFALVFVALHLLVAWLMWRRRWFVRV